MKFLIDTAHAKGLSVFLDVVYNHFGPEGNYSLNQTLSLATVQQSGEQRPILMIRNMEKITLFIANAVHWLDEYHFDGLRVDAIHCMKDESESRGRGYFRERPFMVFPPVAPVMLIAETTCLIGKCTDFDGGYGFDAHV